MAMPKSLLFTYMGPDALLTTLMVRLESVTSHRPHRDNDEFVLRPFPMLMAEVSPCGTAGTLNNHLLEMAGLKFAIPYQSRFERDPHELVIEVEGALSTHLPKGYWLQVSPK